MQIKCSQLSCDLISFIPLLLVPIGGSYREIFSLDCRVTFLRRTQPTVVSRYLLRVSLSDSRFELRRVICGSAKILIRQEGVCNLVDLYLVQKVQIRTLYDITENDRLRTPELRLKLDLVRVMCH